MYHVKALSSNLIKCFQMLISINRWGATLENMESKSFEIVLDQRVLETLRIHIEKYGLTVENVNGNKNGFKIIMKDFTFTDIYDLGWVTCYYPYVWDRNLEDKIIERSSFNFLGKKMFDGTDEEKRRLDELDRSRLIDFPDNYFDDFIFKLKKENKKTSILEGGINFEIMLNFEDSTFGIDHKYNQTFNTDFKVREVYLDDTMYFAKIEATEIGLIDIFCFGYMVALNDERRLEKKRSRNTHN